MQRVEDEGDADLMHAKRSSTRGSMVITFVTCSRIRASGWSQLEKQAVSTLFAQTMGAELVEQDGSNARYAPLIWRCRLICATVCAAQLLLIAYAFVFLLRYEEPYLLLRLMNIPTIPLCTPARRSSFSPQCFIRDRLLSSE